ncbi:Predicted Cu2 homeostasis protein CutC [Phaffia rhodozyma]|uniref:Copper homeostasis protein cutC homolog n=1 Tax=Phaffia rhodozyma TaxID=264483 RepID=A0A0F7SNW3_PHARH|nr:Predicted Cu2 homeostasis protein CutC [Phaffia rhodozyma]
MTHKKILLEVCVDSFDSAKTAVDNGADRLEICGSLCQGGGTTPSVALVNMIQSELPKLPLMIMIRPRPGDFVYSESEVRLMKAEIATFRRLRVMGVVFGCLKPDGMIDELVTSELAACAGPLEVTFHRAFDMINYPSADGPLLWATSALCVLDTIPKITRVLTSGLQPTFPSSLSYIKSIIDQSVSLSKHSASSCPRRPLTILPGSGISAASILAHPEFCQLLREGMFPEIHASCSSWVDGPMCMKARKEGMGMGRWERWKVMPARVRELREVLDGCVS